MLNSPPKPHAFVSLPLQSVFIRYGSLLAVTIKVAAVTGLYAAAEISSGCTLEPLYNILGLFSSDFLRQHGLTDAQIIELKNIRVDQLITRVSECNAQVTEAKGHIADLESVISDLKSVTSDLSSSIPSLTISNPLPTLDPPCSNPPPTDTQCN